MTSKPLIFCSQNVPAFILTFKTRQGSEKPMNYTKKIGRNIGGAMLLIIVGACSPTGDFGRASRPVQTVFDSLPMPNDPDNFSLIQSDEETRMKNLMQRFVSTIQGQSWLGNILLGARVLAGATPNQTDYYLWLKSQRYNNSSSRYRALLNEIQLDILSLPNVFEAICAVEQTDQRRKVAAQNLEQTSQQTLQAVNQRKQQNDQRVQTFVQRVSFRYGSYSYALENLLIESPDELARQVDGQLNILAPMVQQGQAKQFC